jgi:hypothetical protein
MSRVGELRLLDPNLYLGPGWTASPYGAVIPRTGCFDAAWAQALAVGTGSSAETGPLGEAAAADADGAAPAAV